MSLTFYYSPMSTASLTAIVIEELGIPHERVRIDIQKGDNKKPEFLKLNPNGKVPVIVHDGTPIWESSAITMYLGEVYGVDKKLYPAQGPKRGEAMRWICWTNVTLGEAVYRWARNTQWAPEEERNAKAAATAMTDVLDTLKLLDTQLTGRQYLLGDDYTLADAHVNSFVDWLRYMKIDLSAFASLNAWSGRCTARPAYRKVMSEQ